ncbi:cytochrome P450 monooxygenase [Penicillium verrucosum]|uniref:cytochrome P450 monooxygenase n=1 Tax=Penicillium verrucosum TaxID=60171 RepID=UPI0025456DC3|nr:cytochrome P450 monooxygenase [Penicillium verrucosum]KAJ5941769.1 cytochrome P450 monooxygenase [Penicillium verrucosum]
MSRLGDNFGILYIGAAAAVYFKPEHAIYDSRLLTLIAVFSIITLFKLIYNVSLYPALFTPLKQIQTPPDRHWLRGNGESIFIDTPFEPMKKWAHNMPNDGLIRYYIVGNLERVFPTSTAALREILVNKAYDFAKPRTIQQFLYPIVGHGLLLAEGEEHKVQRKSLMPAFSYRHIKDLYPIFWAKSSEMVKRIEQDLQHRGPAEDNTIQVSNWVGRAALDIIGVAGMDQDFDSLRNPSGKLNKSYHKVFTMPSFGTKMLLLLGIIIGDITWVQKLPTKRNNDIQDGRQTIRDVARQMIREKRENLKNTGSQTSVDIISVAIAGDSTFDEEKLVDQLMTFLAAGHETTASAMQWAVYTLSNKPEIQTRLREEIRANLPSIFVESPEQIDAVTIDNLPYLHAVCNEILRFHPSVPNTNRVALKDTTLVGKPIPKGTTIVLAPEVINKLEGLWGPDAAEFNPDRFMGPGMANTGGATSNYALLTFLHGPRRCIGHGFAKGELACLLAATVGRFKFELKYPDAKLEVREGATHAPKDGVLAKFTSVEGW